jgi:5-methylcytosine-specific restriction endonuclease McrA
MSRKRFTERQVVETLLLQGAVIRCPRCKQCLLLEDVPAVEREHFLEIALGGADTPANCFYSHGPCHSVVTNGRKLNRAGSSKNKIAKAKRMAAGGRKRKGPAIPSRPFPKISRKFSHVVPR